MSYIQKLVWNLLRHVERTEMAPLERVGYLADDVAQIVSTTPRLTRWVVRLFRCRFNAVANRILLRAYERGAITSRQMHVLAKQFDPTQNGVVGRL